MNDFISVVRGRRSANKFIKGMKVPRQDFEEIFEDLGQAPSCFNLQHAHYYIGESEEVIEQLYEASNKQFKVLGSSATIIVTGAKNAYKHASEIYEACKFLKIIDNEEYEATISAINGLYENGGEKFQQEEAIRNASMSAMLFLLLAKNKGWDTCPMIYFDQQKARDIFDIPEDEVPVLMISMGKIDKASLRGRGYRKPMNEYVKFK